MTAIQAVPITRKLKPPALQCRHPHAKELGDQGGPCARGHASIRDFQRLAPILRRGQSRFDTALDASTNVDRITDFSLSQNDRIQLENSGTGLFNAITRTGTLATGAFIRGAAFTTTTQRIRYDSASGSLFYDPDGTGAQASILFATLNAGLAMTNSQFVVT